jgi:hypothetical protein
MAAELWNLSVSSATVASLFAMALLDCLYFVGSPENKKCSPHKWRAKENREISNLLIFTYVGKHFSVFLSQNKPKLKNSCDFVLP